MALRVTSEERAEIKDHFLMENEDSIHKYARVIIDYCKSKTLLSDKTVIGKTIGNSLSRIEDISGNILFVLSTMEEGAIPLQSLAGQIVPFISQSDTIEMRELGMLTAMELLMVSKPYAEFSISQNGYYMVESKISSKNLITKNISLPLTRPTMQHKKLGMYEWELSDTSRALDELNHMQMTLIDLKDVEPAKPTGDKYSKEYLKQEEVHNKWKMRQALLPHYKGKKIFFNWAADYRVRMYPVGYYFNPQGNELEKNMIGFYKGENLDFQGIQQLKKSIASAYGLEKKNDPDKLAWFIKNKNVLHLRKNSAKEPHTFEVLLMAWKNHLNGEKIHIPVEIDATNSQAQVMAVLLKKKSIAITCNVINVKDDDGIVQIADLYQLVADEMSDIIAEQKKEIAA